MQQYDHLDEQIFLTKKREFFQNVWNHAADEFQSSFDSRRYLSHAETTLLDSIRNSFLGEEPDAEVAVNVRNILNGDPNKIELLLQICGLTRNKILQDIKAASGEDRKKLKLSNHLTLSGDDDTWNYAGSYLISRLRKVLSHELYEALNQATWPGYMRQERAKRSGHEAEYRIAMLLNNCSIPFQPEGKADNPLCRDAQWQGLSFDIVIPNAEAPLVCIKSTVHTANIGQYGESKNYLEIHEARRLIDKTPMDKRPMLVGFIDGVGFESNIDALRHIFQDTDEFCQFNTIWKLVVISCHCLKKTCYLSVSPADAEQHSAFIKRYASIIQLNKKPPKNAIKAGHSLLYVD